MIRKTGLASGLSALFYLFGCSLAWADGNETLNTPSIPIAAGSGIAAGGTGLETVSSGTIAISVPSGATVLQALLYWSGETVPGDASGGDANVTLSGNPVTGTLIGSSALNSSTVAAFRADITGLGLIGSGASSLTIADVAFSNKNLGAGIAVIYDDGSGATIEVRDGIDHAFINNNLPNRNVTDLQTFSFPPSPNARNVQIVSFFDDGKADRDDEMEIVSGGVTTTYAQVIVGADGDQFDTFVTTAVVPAGASDLSVQMFSRGTSNPDSFDWILLATVLPAAQVPAPALGDRVFEDLDADGVQDCDDTSGNGIIGDAGDTGPECNAGIAGLPVELLEPGPDLLCGSGDEIPLGLMAITDADGFYLFPDLDSGNYCVQFTLPGADFCVTDGFDLGSPVFSLRNQGDDEQDSDADPVTGQSDVVSLAVDDDLTIDAGVVCPAKLGDRVFLDDGDGIQDPGESGIEGIVVNLFDCGPDGMAGTMDDIDLMQTRSTGPDGLYMFGGEPGVFDLPPGNYYTIFEKPAGLDFTLPGQGGDPESDSDCNAPDGATACTGDLGSRGISLATDCGLVPPPVNCDLVLDKTCRVEAPPPVPFEKCDGKLEQFTVIWTGAPVTVGGPANDAPGGAVGTNQEVTFFGPFGQNDVVVDLSGSVSGQSVFHMSCSDIDFNSPDDCGKAAGNGKSDDAGLINAWLLEGFVDASGLVLDCTETASNDDFIDDCAFTAPPTPSCENGKPDTLGWRYDGGTLGDGNCADSTFFGVDHDDFACTGAVDTGLQITVVDDGGAAYLVAPGETFTTPRDSSDRLQLTDSAGNVQEIELHTSCSQTLETGLTGGALTLVAFDGNDGSVNVTYRYEVSNPGDALSGVTVTDNPLGHIAGPFDMASGAMESFTTTVALSATTINTATAAGTLADGAICSPSSATDQTVVDVVAPVCEVSLALYKIDDKKIKWKLSNNGGVPATLKTLTVSWPGGESLKKIKFDGTDILKNDLRAAPSTTVLESEWLKEAKKRRVQSGEVDKLEIEFTDKFPLKKNQPATDFTLDLEFVEGCSVQF